MSAREIEGEACSSGRDTIECSKEGDKAKSSEFLRQCILPRNAVSIVLYLQVRPWGPKSVNHKTMLIYLPI